MSIKTLAAQMRKSLETASIEEYLETNTDPVTSRLVFEVTRANALLEKNKNKIFLQHLNISSRADAEKAVIAYNNPYFLALPIPLDTLGELVQSIKDICKQYRATPPRSWDDIINGVHSTENVTAEDESEEDGYRFKPDL